MNQLVKHIIFSIALIHTTGCGAIVELGDKAYYDMIHRGIRNFEKGNIKMAEKSFTRAVNDSTKPEGFFWLGRVKEVTTPSPEDEIQLYKKAIQINPNYLDAYSRLSFVLIKKGKFSEARDYLIDQVSNNPKSSKFAYSNIAYTYFWEDNYNQAEIYYKKTLLIDPNYTFGLNGLAKIYSVTQKYDEAREILKRSLSIDDSHKNRGAYANFAKLEEMQENYEEAKSYWKKFLAFKNNPPEDVAEAIKALERIEGKQQTRSAKNRVFP